MSGTLDVKGVDEWAVYLLELWAESHLFLPDRVQETGKRLTYLVWTEKLLLKVAAFFFFFYLFHLCHFIVKRKQTKESYKREQTYLYPSHFSDDSYTTGINYKKHCYLYREDAQHFPGHGQIK